MLVTDLLIRRISTSRAVAFEVLEAVYNGEYATDMLLELSSQVDSRDASLASQIVFGCLRFQGQLDYLIELYSGRSAARLDTVVVLSLRAGIFQLRYLDRVPAHAAVHESVEFVKARKRAASGMVNAVLRKVDRKPIAWPNKSVELSCPRWLLDKWTGQFGEMQAEAIASAALAEPVRYIRVPVGTEPPAGMALEATEVEGCFRVVSATQADGIRLHDISSQAIVPMLELEPGNRYLDVCSAPGNKTLQALETPLGFAIAADISFKRLRDVPAMVPRIVLDGTWELPFSRQFDRIFVDAPCSGTGTLSRNPEIKWRVQGADINRFAERQTAILRQSFKLLAPGGRLLYATCSLEAEENEKVVAAGLRDSPGRELIREMWRLPGRDEGDGFYAALLA